MPVTVQCLRPSRPLKVAALRSISGQLHHSTLLSASSLRIARSKHSRALGPCNRNVNPPTDARRERIPFAPRYQFRRWQSQHPTDAGGTGAAVPGTTCGGASDYQLGPGNEIQPTPSTQSFGAGGSGGKKGEKAKWYGTAFKMFEAAATTGASIAILGLAGYGYHKYYKYLVLKKIHGAFQPGDPALTLAAAGQDPEPDDESWYSEASKSYPRNKFLVVLRDEQEQLDDIIAGKKMGYYYLLIGEKGTGKSSMLLDAMRKIDGDNCSVLEAHADTEVFRSRLGKAIDFEYHEDYIGSLFSIRGPRETTSILDIERAFNKLEKVALHRKKKNGKPLILIINSMHLIRDDDEGRDLLELLQQRAEAWAAQKLITMIFNSDDYWVYERLKQYASRMELISVTDLPKGQAITALRRYRGRYFKEDVPDSVAERIYEQIGGRLAFLNRVAKSKDMLGMCREIVEMEKTWLLSQCGLLGTDMDDDVMNQQKYASSAMVLVRHLVEMERQRDTIYDPSVGHQLPELPLYQARQVMTRAEFIQQYDHMNIFTIDSKCNVRADSVPMQIAFREVAEEEGFDQYLEDTLTRIADIESLGRTRELTIKDLWHGGKYNVTVKNHKGMVERVVSMDVEEGKRGNGEVFEWPGWTTGWWPGFGGLLWWRSSSASSDDDSASSADSASASASES